MAKKKKEKREVKQRSSKKQPSSKNQRDKSDIELLYISLKGFSWYDPKKYPNEEAADEAFSNDPEELPQGVHLLEFKDSHEEIDECFFRSPSLKRHFEREKKKAPRGGELSLKERIKLRDWERKIADIVLEKLLTLTKDDDEKKAIGSYVNGPYEIRLWP